MRFNGDAYEKVFPRITKPVETIESAVETFHPTNESQPAIESDTETTPGEGVSQLNIEGGDDNGIRTDNEFDNE